MEIIAGDPFVAAGYDGACPSVSFATFSKSVSVAGRWVFTQRPLREKNLVNPPEADESCQKSVKGVRLKERGW